MRGAADAAAGGKRCDGGVIDLTVRGRWRGLWTAGVPRRGRMRGAAGVAAGGKGCDGGGGCHGDSPCSGRGCVGGSGQRGSGSGNMFCSVLYSVF